MGNGWIMFPAIKIMSQCIYYKTCFIILKQNLFLISSDFGVQLLLWDSPYVHLTLVFLSTSSAIVHNQNFHEDQKKTVQISSKTHSIIYTRQPFIFFKRLFFERGQFQTHSFVKKESQLSISLSFTNYASTENLWSFVLT